MLCQEWQLFRILYPQIPALPGFPVTGAGHKQRAVVAADEDHRPLKIFRRQVFIHYFPDSGRTCLRSPALTPEHHPGDQNDQQAECHTAARGQWPESQNEPQRQYGTQTVNRLRYASRIAYPGLTVWLTSPVSEDERKNQSAAVATTATTQSASTRDDRCAGVMPGPQSGRPVPA